MNPYRGKSQSDIEKPSTSGLARAPLSLRLDNFTDLENLNTAYWKDGLTKSLGSQACLLLPCLYCL